MNPLKIIEAPVYGPAGVRPRLRLVPGGEESPDPPKIFLASLKPGTGRSPQACSRSFLDNRRSISSDDTSPPFDERDIIAIDDERKIIPTPPPEATAEA
jgi:hypothetical protein